jgi:hypothetical protein
MGKLGELFSGGKAPAPQPVVRMPDQNDPASLEARRRQQREQIAGKGRDSTILTGPGGDYSGSVLGS